MSSVAGALGMMAGRRPVARTALHVDADGGEDLLLGRTPKLLQLFLDGRLDIAIDVVVVVTVVAASRTIFNVELVGVLIRPIVSFSSQN